MAKSLIYGINAVESALNHDAENLVRVWIDKRTRNERLLKLQPLLKTAGISCALIDPNKLDEMAGRDNRHQGVVAEYKSAKEYDENDLYDLLDKLDEPPFLLILDGVTDPHNLGACLRTAEGAGVHAVIAPRDNAVGLTPTVRKVASGAAELVPFMSVTNLARTMSTLRDRGIWITGTSDKANKNLYAAELTGAIALVMGAEGQGIRRLTEENCDFLISIPMLGKVSSLNVSVATGVCLYEALRQRRPNL
ncbi:MAG: rRNA ((2251)-2-O)-methyltransferase RlmB [Pseudomonadota bacterium]|jgi:23S rRNA (guanosine2251-2'-O)-methyltransferase